MKSNKIREVGIMIGREWELLKKQWEEEEIINKEGK